MQKISNYRQWTKRHSTKGLSFAYDEYYPSPIYRSKCIFKEGVMTCIYILRSKEELDSKRVRRHIVFQMSPWRARMLTDRYICVVNPLSRTRGKHNYEIQYYQSMDEPSTEFALDFEKACLSSIDYASVE